MSLLPDQAKVEFDNYLAHKKYLTANGTLRELSEIYEYFHRVLPISYIAERVYQYHRSMQLLADPSSDAYKENLKAQSEAVAYRASLKKAKDHCIDTSAMGFNTDFEYN